MKAYKVLLLGDANHIFIKNFAIWLRKQWKNDIIIDIFSFNDQCNHESIYDNIYYCKPMKIFPISFIGKVIYNLYQLPHGFKKIQGNYDVVHIHQLFFNYYFILKQIINKSNSLIISYWGNDFYERNRMRDILKRVVVNKASHICCSSAIMKKHIEQRYNIPEVKLIGYSSSVIEELRKLESLTKSDIKKQQSIDEDSIVITCGYSQRSEHKQLEVLKAIEQAKFNKKIHLIFPMTYGNDPQNLNTLIEASKKSKIPIKIETIFQTDHDVAILRKVSDIFIHIVDHDQCSASMLEYLYGKNIVVVGSWLPFSNLEEMGVSFEKIDKIGDLRNRLEYVIKHYEDYLGTSVKNSQVIQRFESWETIISKWTDLYKSI